MRYFVYTTLDQDDCIVSARRWTKFKLNQRAIDAFTRECNRVSRRRKFKNDCA